MINLISDDKKKYSNETKLQTATDGGRSKAQQPTPQQTHQLSQSEAWKAANAFVSDQKRIPRTLERIPRTSERIPRTSERTPRTLERTPRTSERIRQRIRERRTNFRKNLIWERTPVKTAGRAPERYEERFTLGDDEDMEWMDPTGTTHCSYLDIYISQKIRLCKGDF